MGFHEQSYLGTVEGTILLDMNGHLMSIMTCYGSIGGWGFILTSFEFANSCFGGDRGGAITWN